MFRWWILAFACGIATPVLLSAEDQNREVLTQKYQRKMGEPFVTKIAWERKMTDAMAKSLATERPIVGYFTRSYSA
ncbi:MAG: hypothetical protein L0Z55_07630 [Planctomycetes bacterium]|nr:hypothetical protein [Planctomycetota bacterium]